MGRGEFTFLFQWKIIKRIKPPKCSITYLQTSLIPQFSHRDTPRPSFKRERAEVGGGWGKKRGRLRHGCRNQNCASAPVVAWPTRKSQSCMLSAFPSEVAWRFDEVTVHIGDVTGGHSFILGLLIQSFFGISYRQLSMPKDLTLSKNQCL